MFSNLFISAALAQSLTCVIGQIRMNAANSKLEQASYCYNSLKDQFISQSCLKEECQMLHSKIKKIPRSSLISEWGKPGSRLCRLHGGNFEIVEFWAEGKWWKLDRCMNSNDNSFVDTDTLLLRYSF